MTASIIDGAAISEQIRAEVAEEVKARAIAGKPIPGLATVLVGENPASHVYVRSKHKACQEAGIRILRTRTSRERQTGRGGGSG